TAGRKAARPARLRKALHRFQFMAASIPVPSARAVPNRDGFRNSERPACGPPQRSYARALMKFRDSQPGWRSRAEIDLDALRHNVRVAQSFLPDEPAGIIAVVKANAYGHGAVP